MRTINKKNKNNSGFTIIETMIAVSLFLIVVMVGMGALLNANLIHSKSQDTRSILDNLSFVMDDMSRNLRTGSEYHCIDATDSSLTETGARDCVNGKGISFKSASGSQWVYAIFDDKSIRKFIGGEAQGSITSPEIKIDGTSSFIISGALPPPSDVRQPFVTIKLVGKIISSKGVETPFTIQTSVSQRLVDIGS